MQADFDKAFGKEVIKAVVLTALATTVSQLVAWVFEKMKRQSKEKDQDNGGYQK
jgi:hypothetical protein